MPLRVEVVHRLSEDAQLCTLRRAHEGQVGCGAVALHQAPAHDPASMPHRPGEQAVLRDDGLARHALDV
eukprot:10576441-Alexandrium_andersonii.AAC.1